MSASISAFVCFSALTGFTETLSNAMKRNPDAGEAELDLFIQNNLPKMPNPVQTAQLLCSELSVYSAAHESTKAKLREAQALATFLGYADSSHEQEEERKRRKEKAISELQQALQGIMSGSDAVKVDAAVEHSLDTYNQRLHPEDVAFVSKFSKNVITLCIKIAYLYMLEKGNNESISSNSSSTNPSESTPTHNKTAELASAAIIRGSRLLEYLTPDMNDVETAYKVMHARTLEACGEYLRASKAFSLLAQSEKEGKFSAESSLQRVCGGFYRNSKEGSRTPLESALVCAVLARPGNERSKIIELLLETKAPNNKPIPKLTIYDKLLSDRIVRSEDISEFEKHVTLLTYHEKRAFKNAIAQHNLLCVSKVYTSVSFERLAELLFVESPSVAEDIAAQMITDGTLSTTTAAAAELDQVDSCIYFKALSLQQPQHTSVPFDLWGNRTQKLCAFIDSFELN